MVLKGFFKTIILSILLIASTSFATPDLLPFQGRLTDSSGSPINIATVVKFRIYPPSGTCYLYEDTQTITPNTYGIFTALLGAAGNVTFAGPMVNFRDVFNNSSAGIVNNCSTLYIPAQNDWRRIEVEAGGVTSPDMQTIGAAPFSFESKNSLNLGGLPSTSFLRVNGALTQFAAEALVNGNDASAYHDHDSLYARLDGSTPYTGNISTVANIYTTAGTVGIGTATAAADLEVNKTNPDIRLTATAAGGGTSKIDFFSGAAAQRASIQSSEATNEMRFFTGTTEAMRLDANQNAFFNSSLDVAGTLSLGQYSSAQETSILLPNLTTSGAAATGTVWVNTGGVIKFWDGGNIRTIANLNAVVNSVTAGTGTTIGGTATAPTVSVNYGTTAGTAIQGNATFGGDVSGNYSNLTVDRIDGSAVDLSVAPAATQVLKFNGTAWVAAADATGITAETDPTVTAWAKNAPAANFVTTGNVLQLSNSGVTAGTYGSGSVVPVFTVDIFGRISSVTNTSIGINANQVTAGILPVTRGGTGATTLTGEGILVMNTTGTAATSMTCGVNQILKWTGTAWACAADNDSVDGDASYVAKGNVQFDTNAATSGITVTAGVARLANSGATAGSYGSGTQVPSIAVDAFGRITSVSNTAIALSASDITSGTLPIARGGTNSTTALNNNRLMVSSGGSIVEAGALTNGQLLVGSTGAAPVAATLTAGGGVTVTNGAGSITLGANTAVLQARVTGTCASGSSISSIAADGTVTCETDDNTAPGDASYAAKGIVQFDTNAATSGITVAAGVARLASSGVTAASYGSTTQVPVFSVDAFGRLTTVTNTTIVVAGDVSGNIGTTTVNRIQNKDITGTYAADRMLWYDQSADDYVLSNLPTCGANEYLTFNGTTWSCAADAGASGTVASVASTAPVRINGGTTAATGAVTVSVDSASYASSGVVRADTDAATSGLSLAAGVLRLANSGATAGTYGSGTQVPAITVDAFGRITSVSNTTIALSASDVTSGTLPIARGGTNSGTALNNNRLMVSSGGAIVEAGALTNGQLLVGSTGAAPVAAAITGGGGVTVTNGAGSITLGANTAVLQARVASTCAAGSSIREIAADGTVTCETDDNNATPGDASYAAKGIVQFDTNAATSGITVAAGIARLANSGATAGSYGSASSVSAITVDAFGRITTAASTAIAINANQVTAGTLPVTRGGTGATTLTGEGILVMNTTGTAATSMTCGVNQILKWNGSAWACAADSDTADGDASYVAKGNVQFDTNAATSGITVAAGVARLANSGVTAASYGSTTQVPAITVDAFGRLTAVTNTTIVAAGDVSGNIGTTTVNRIQNKDITGTYAADRMLWYDQSADDYVLSNLPTCGANQYLTFDGTTWSCAADAGASGTVASVASTAPVRVNGGTTAATGAVTVTVDNASYASSGVIRADTDAATSGLSLAAGVLRLANSGATAGTYGSGTQVPAITVDAFGRITSVSNTTIALSAADITSGTLPIARGGTNSTTALNNNRVMVSSGGSIVEAGALTNGQLLVGSTGAAPVAAAITAGGGVTVTNGAGSITLGANTAVLQARVTGTCASGSSISSIAADGTVTCETDDNTAPGDASYAAKGIVQFDTNAATSGITVAAGVARLANSGVTAASYGSTTQVPAITVDAFGRLTAVTNTTIVAAGDVSGNIGTTTVNRIQNKDITGTYAADRMLWYDQSADDYVLSNLPTCGANEYLTFNGTAWSCDTDDNANPGDASYAAKGIIQFDTNAATSGITVAAGVARLANSGATAGTYGSGTQVPAITVDAFGRITSVSNTTIALSAADITSGTLPIARGGTNSTTALNNNRVMVSSGGAIVESAALTNGQLLIGSTGVAPVAAAITGGGGVTVTNGAGSITLGANTAVLQARVTGTCAAGSSIREIAADGTVTCEADDNSSTPGDASYAAKGIVQFDTNAATSGITVAAGIARLANSGVTAATYGSGSTVSEITVDAFGRITAAASTAIAINANQVTAGTLPVTRGGTGAATLTGEGILVMNTTGTAATSMTCGVNQILKWNGTAWACAADDNANPGDASYAAKGIVQFDTNAATSGITVAAGVARLANSGVTAATYGSATQVPAITVDAFGRITSVTNTTIALSASDVTSGTLPIARGGTNSATALNNDRMMVSSGGSIVEAAALTNGQLFVGVTGAAPSAVTMSGDATLSSTGVLALAGNSVASAEITADTIVDSDINSAANITATKLGTGVVDNTEFNYLNGVTSAIQTQLGARLPLAGGTMTGTLNAASNGLVVGTSQLVVVGGSVGVNTATPSATYKLDVVGDIRATAFFYSSDRRLKYNIQEMKGLETILRLRGVKFQWKDDGRPEIGLIAQEVEQVAPELVQTDAVTGLKAVKYGNLVAPLIESVQELYGMCESNTKSIQKMDRSIASHDDKIKVLESTVENLKNENLQMRKELDEIKKLLHKK